LTAGPADGVLRDGGAEPRAEAAGCGDQQAAERRCHAHPVLVARPHGAPRIRSAQETAKAETSQGENYQKLELHSWLAYAGIDTSSAGRIFTISNGTWRMQVLLHRCDLTAQKELSCCDYFGDRLRYRAIARSKSVNNFIADLFVFCCFFCFFFR